MKHFVVLNSVLLISSVSSHYSDLNVIIMKSTQKETLALSSLDKTFLASKLYDPALKTVLVFTGWRTTCTDVKVQQSKKAFEVLGGYNFLCADWTAYNSGFYFKVGNNLQGIANTYGEKFAAMITADQLSLAKWHFIGASLGAHLAGSIARKIRLKSSDSKYVVPRITALDPAGRCFYPASIFLLFYQGLKKSDAAFVDVIHTDQLLAGTTYKVGHVDFWVNADRKVQPGCPAPPPLNIWGIIRGMMGTGYAESLGCSHSRSIDILIESITMNSRKTAFLAVKCTSSQSKSEQHLCSKFSKTTSNFLGLYATKIPPGNFFLKTNAAFQYSLS